MSEPVHTSETPAPVAPEAPAPTPEAPVEEVIPGAEHLGDPGKQALDRIKAERNQIRADRDALKAKLQEIEDRNLSDLQKAQRDRDELATRLAEVEREAVRNRVALAKQIPAEIAAGPPPNADEAALAAYADALLAWRGNLPPTTPRPDSGQGPRPSTPEAEAAQDYLRFFPDEAPKAR